MKQTAFRKGDLVFLDTGTYAGTRGTFLNLRTDVKWATVQQENGVTREFPVEYLASRRAGQAFDFHPEVLGP
jgi:hypothetical protein